MLLGSVEPVTEIAEARDNELVGVEAGIHNRRKDMYVWMMPLHQGDSLGGGDDADHPDVTRACPSEQVERRDGAPASGQHRIDDQDEAPRQILRQLRIVLRGDGGHLVALESDVPDACGRYQFQNRIQHSQSRPQDGDDDHVASDTPPARRSERSFYRDIP